MAGASHRAPYKQHSPSAHVVASPLVGPRNTQGGGPPAIDGGLYVSRHGYYIVLSRSPASMQSAAFSVISLAYPHR